MRWWMWTFGLAWLVGCGTALYVTPEPLGAETVLQYKLGAQRMQCREQPSAEFALFVVCPRRNQAIGFRSIEGKTSLTCVDLWPRNCKHLANKLLSASVAPLAKVPNAAP